MTKTVLFIELTNQNKNGVSRWVLVSEFRSYDTDAMGEEYVLFNKKVKFII